MWDEMFNNYTVYMLVFARMLGMVMFNPIFDRKNMPNMLKAGLCLATTLLMAGKMANAGIEITSFVQFAAMALLELSIGLIIGYIVQLFLNVVVIGGEIIDLQIGMGMAKIMDPSTNIQMPITGSIYNLFFLIYFFMINGHLTLIKIVDSSFGIIPVGFTAFNANVLMYIIQLFSQIFALGIKFSLPIMAAEIIAEVAMGLLMKTVPQINIFMLNIQLKLGLGFLLLLTLSVPMSKFIDNLINVMFQNIGNALNMIA
ncbi:MAG TPA: flagellar biosynthetic protein FliR [Ruminococcaceae bacterium]|nr:flagellar biosynthetic protein FliR [Oscillospiraceae bacterium]